MGAWGITMRESDYGLDLLSVIVEEQLKPVQFAYLDTVKAIELLRQHILDEIKHCNRECSQEELDYYIEINFPRDFTQAALLIAECLGEYYRTGELVFYEYIEKTCELQERHVKQVIAAGEALPVLLEEVGRVQDPDHEIYQSWIREETRQKWLAHIRALREILEAHR